MEILGDYFIEKTIGCNPSGKLFEYWEVGEVLVMDGAIIFKKSDDYCAENREIALIYIRNLANSYGKLLPSRNMA